MVNMKALLVPALVFVTLNALAHVAGSPGRRPVKNYIVNDSKIASLNVQVLDIGEPAIQPFLMTAKVKCVDNRAKAHSVKPKEDLVISEKVCEFRAFNYDDKAKTATIQYSTLGEDMSECENPLVRTVNLSEVCAPFNK